MCGDRGEAAEAFARTARPARSIRRRYHPGYYKRGIQAGSPAELAAGVNFLAAKGAKGEIAITGVINEQNWRGGEAAAGPEHENGRARETKRAREVP